MTGCDQWLVEILIDADVTSPGRAGALVKGSHLAQTRYAHQVTALLLSILRKDAYSRFTVVCEENWAELLSFKTWCIQQGSKVPQFKYWQMVYDMEMLLLRFVPSIRTGDLFLNEKSLDEIADWAFIFDHYNYAHWLPVHVRDMMNAQEKHPALYIQFADGFFTIAKTQNLSQ